MHFGLKNAAQTFKRIMDSLFISFPFKFINLDNVLIFNKNHANHLLHQKQVFDMLVFNGLRINPGTCIFFCLRLTVLATVSIPLVSHLSPPKFSPFCPFPLPWTFPLFSCFSACSTFYCCFLPGIAAILRPLMPVLVPILSPGVLTWKILSDCNICVGICHFSPSPLPYGHPFSHQGHIRLPCRCCPATTLYRLLAAPCLFQLQTFFYEIPLLHFRL
jgi:hypothetical protein